MFFGEGLIGKVKEKRRSNSGVLILSAGQAMLDLQHVY